MDRFTLRRALLALCLGLTANAAWAHTGNMAGGFASGFTHPLFGWDHVVAMVAVGLWGAFLGMPAIWVLPVTFPLVMTIGGALGVAGVPRPGGLRLGRQGRQCGTCRAVESDVHENSSPRGRAALSTDIGSAPPDLSPPVVNRPRTVSRVFASGR